MTKLSSDTPMDNFDDFLTAAQDAPNYDHDCLDKSEGWAPQKLRGRVSLKM
jgi:hypothetical protein